VPIPNEMELRRHYLNSSDSTRAPNCQLSLFSNATDSLDGCGGLVALHLFTLSSCAKGSLSGGTRSDLPRVWAGARFAHISCSLLAQGGAPQLPTGLCHFDLNGSATGMVSHSDMFGDVEDVQ
jgi:hypothetical protein